MICINLSIYLLGIYHSVGVDLKYSHNYNDNK